MSGQLINITFHGIGNPRTAPKGEEQVWVTEDQFRALLDAAVGRPDVRMTFDDGNASDYLVGLPALLDRKLKAVFFIVAGRLDSPEYLSRDQVREMSRAGMTIGVHGMRHRSWRGLSDQGLQEEIMVARKQIEEVTGKAAPWASCPFGEYDRRVLDALRVAGYERVFTSDRGPASSEDWLQRRNTVWDASDADAEWKRLVGGAWEPGMVRTVKQLVKRWR